MTAPITFNDAQYIPPAGGPGREAAPNPFADIVSDLALKVDDNSKPVAKAFTFEHPAIHGGAQDVSEADVKEYERIVAKYKRDLANAGEKNDPKVTVKSVVKPVTNPVNGKVSPTKSTMTFWTVKRQNRPRKSVEAK